MSSLEPGMKTKDIIVTAFGQLEIKPQTYAAYLGGYKSRKMAEAELVKSAAEMSKHEWLLDRDLRSI